MPHSLTFHIRRPLGLGPALHPTSPLPHSLPSAGLAAKAPSPYAAGEPRLLPSRLPPPGLVPTGPPTRPTSRPTALLATAPHVPRIPHLTLPPASAPPPKNLPLPISPPLG
ncbi:hypothetical protein K32_11640 [Kaistia sp. 32K]|nr:hypothetical protein K32_11640 [Kaistia sp. 32K]